MNAKHALFAPALTCALAFAVALGASRPALAGSVGQASLTSDGAVTAAFTDTNLKNPWGMSYSPTGPFWVSDNATGLTTLYDGTGKPQPLVVTIPAAGGGTVGNPTGQVFNATAGFSVSQGGKTGASAFIFCSEDGSISGWAPSVNFASAITAVDFSAKGAVFKGLALLTDKKGKTLLLATDFHGGVVDVFDTNFKLLRSFRDPMLPARYAPYNVAVLGGEVYVTYAKVDATRHDSLNGMGFGAVERIRGIEKVTSLPTVEARFVHGALNGPWGLALAPASWGVRAGDLLVGNFGSGTVEVFNHDLHHLGLLGDSNKQVISIDGLWGLLVGNGGSAGDVNTIYFTAGTNGEADGLFGTLSYTH